MQLLEVPVHLPLPGIVPDAEVDVAVLWCRACGRWDAPGAPCDCPGDALVAVSDEDVLRSLVEGAFGPCERFELPPLFDP